MSVYFRWHITKRRGATSRYTVQASELNLYDGAGARIAWPAGTSAACNLAAAGSSETPDKLVDNVNSTKWLAVNGGNTAEIDAIVTITTPQKPDAVAYSFTTANDDANRDPVTWTLAYSEDGEAWVVLSTVENAAVPTGRNTATQTWELDTPIVQRAFYLVRAGETLYTVREGALQTLTETAPTAALFAAYGTEEPPSGDLLKTLANPAVLKWADAEELLPMTATVTGTPYPQTLEAVADMTSETVLGISSLTANYSGAVGVRYSVDEKASYSEEMTVADFLNTDRAALYAAASATRRLWLAFTLYEGAKLTDFQITFKN